MKVEISAFSLLSYGLNIAKFKGHLGIHNMMGWQKAISDSTHDC